MKALGQLLNPTLTAVKQLTAVSPNAHKSIRFYCLTFLTQFLIMQKALCE